MIPSPSQKRFKVFYGDGNGHLEKEDFESQKLPDESREVEGLDEMVRDFTSVVPRPKSEVRRRLQEFAREVAEATLEAVEVEPRKHGVMYDNVSAENQEIVGAGYNLALAEVSRREKEFIGDNEKSV